MLKQKNHICKIRRAGIVIYNRINYNSENGFQSIGICKRSVTMTGFQLIIDIFLHLDRHLGAFMAQYGMPVYILLFLIIFCETGLVVTPFLPGDSLIFASGALAAVGIVDWAALPMFIVAAITGNMLNYRIGRFFSDRVRKRQSIKFIKQEYLDKTQRFFDKHGGATIIITRFMPILRTFSPFVAGVGYMTPKRFLIYNAIGGTAWAALFFLIGVLFGNMPFVKTHFSLIVVGIVMVSLIPAVVVYIKSKTGSKN